MSFESLRNYIPFLGTTPQSKEIPSKPCPIDETKLPKIWERACEAIRANNTKLLEIKMTPNSGRLWILQANGLHIGETVIEFRSTYASTFDPGENAAKQLAKLLTETSDLPNLTVVCEPDCPHLAFVTKEKLSTYDFDYRSDQRLYAEWCYKTAKALIPDVETRFFAHMLITVGNSRQTLARICETPQWQHFGRLRTDSLITPILDDYKDWYQFCHKRWEHNNARCIFAKGADGKTVPGTTFGHNRYQPHNNETYFCWDHSNHVYADDLRRVSHDWFDRAVDLGQQDAQDDAFYHALGAFFHSFSQYTPFCRGSAACAMIIISAIFLRFKHPLPNITPLLDCYALSMQQEEFIEHIFIPWCKGVHAQNELISRMNAITSLS